MEPREAASNSARCTAPSANALPSGRGLSRSGFARNCRIVRPQATRRAQRFRARRQYCSRYRRSLQRDCEACAILVELQPSKVRPAAGGCQANSDIRYRVFRWAKRTLSEIHPLSFFFFAGGGTGSGTKSRCRIIHSWSAAFSSFSIVSFFPARFFNSLGSASRS